MTADKQTQKAGENSQLVQAGTINIYNGIDEKRAREICAETYAVLPVEILRQMRMRVLMNVYNSLRIHFYPEC